MCIGWAPRALFYAAEAMTPTQLAQRRPDSIAVRRRNVA